MKNDEFSQSLELRTRQFAIAILKLSLQLSHDPQLDIPSQGVVRAGVSMGANYWEAYRLNDEDDFLDQISLCEHDMIETIYWLNVINDFHVADAITMLSIMHEAGELLTVFSALLDNKMAG
jgi:four helix bundle protein